MLLHGNSNSISTNQKLPGCYFSDFTDFLRSQIQFVNRQIFCIKKTQWSGIRWNKIIINFWTWLSKILRFVCGEQVNYLPMLKTENESLLFSYKAYKTSLFITRNTSFARKSFKCSSKRGAFTNFERNARVEYYLYLSNALNKCACSNYYLHELIVGELTNQN